MYLRDLGENEPEQRRKAECVWTPGVWDLKVILYF